MLRYIKKFNESSENSTSDVMNSIIIELEALKNKYQHDNADYDEWGKGQGISEAIEVVKKYCS